MISIIERNNVINTIFRQFNHRSIDVKWKMNGMIKMDQLSRIFYESFRLFHTVGGGEQQTIQQTWPKEQQQQNFDYFLILDFEVNEIFPFFEVFKY